MAVRSKAGAVETDPLPWKKEALAECVFLPNGGFADSFGEYETVEYSREPSKKILDTVLEAVGRTPLVKLNKIPKAFGVECNVYGKCEFLNAGGSVKDRIAVKMVELAEKTGRLRPGMTVIEPTSGNTGIGLAMVCAVRGYKCIIVMPEKMSREKEVTLKALGAQIVRTPDDAPYDSDESHMGRAFKLRRETPNSVILDQYLNCANPMAHYEGTAAEIIDALNGRVDMVVIGVGTAGTLTGVARRFRERLPDCKIIGVDPLGSVLSGDAMEEHHDFQVEGIGYHFVPSILDINIVSHWERTDDPETFQMARRLNRDEGILSGGSAGALMTAAMRAAKSLKAGQNCVVILPDGIRNYLTKFPADEWMLKKGFMSAEAAVDLEAERRLYPKETFDIRPVYNPEQPSTTPFQWLPEPWPQVKLLPSRPMVIDSVAGAIGYTPLVRLQRLPADYGVEAEILVKLEYLNSGGSVKDRIALKMVELAEQAGALRPGMTIIEPTSGNTGVGLALMAAVRGYRCIIVMPTKMSKEKEVTLRALGAQIVRTANHHAHYDADSHIGVALRLQCETPDSIILDQYRNVGNPLAHYQGTAEEILDACEGRLDAVVLGAGTGGTVTGVAKRIRERAPNCRIIAVDPEGSILAHPDDRSNIHSYEVEGTGYDFVPAVLDRSLVDEWVTTNDAESFAVARKLIRLEGMLCGGSSGANVVAALRVAKKMAKGQRVVTILPDSIRNYMTKFVDDDWMRSKGFPIE